MFSILIIDDEKNVREGLAHFIGNLDGFTVCGTASDGAEALNMCVRLQPDLILTDINMPKVDGLAFISRLRERSKYPHYCHQRVRLFFLCPAGTAHGGKGLPAQTCEPG